MSDFSESLSRGEALRRLRLTLRAADFAMPDLEARLLLAHALGVDRHAIQRDSHLTLGAAASRLQALVERRLRQEPLARILGEAEFWGLPFRLNAATLDPRADTETLVEVVLQDVRQSAARSPGGGPLRILDLGTGSGAILIALLHELRHAFGVGVDRDPAAARMARANAERNGVGARAAFLCGSWAQALHGRFDIIVSNPPYIETPEILHLSREVRDFDPALALDGGGDGLDAYRAIAADLPRLLAPGGLVALEIGYLQAPAVKTLLEAAGFRAPAVHQDLGGHNRVIWAKG
ncbi:peptide chain release factor N(5)-glutamine methyltransferase [Methylovirgula sp. 4M-Z18]|uniref:peptide chain release factor N(5)-glutamine methyltransferase n=1 Tax=Methylovirgula sp. 4M-Z18 TaxID=2293567 RepID=UPI000E2F4D50|nr:peptide chain release factor N(5)-glutamine methyltransferase [Methylovirgula sp. 4M-Z18]RFB81227.1 peptide chain release factor N(5)-glutamine methyltransferase [Methylovirgula sp. 4M-Z18]